MVGAGACSKSRTLNFHFRVCGEAKSRRGEMGAVTEATLQADKKKSLTIFTDCMTLLQIVNRWALAGAGFAPYAEA